RHTRFSRDWSSDVCSSDLRDVHTADLVDQPNPFGVRAAPDPATGDLVNLLARHPSTLGDFAGEVVVDAVECLLKTSPLVLVIVQIGRASCRERVQISVVIV